MKSVFSNFYGNIKELTINNNYYRQVLNTTPTQQLVGSKTRFSGDVLPDEEIGLEVHPYITQFIRIESEFLTLSFIFYEIILTFQLELYLLIGGVVIKNK